MVTVPPAMSRPLAGAALLPAAVTFTLRPMFTVPPVTWIESRPVLLMATFWIEAVEAAPSAKSTPAPEMSWPMMVRTASLAGARLALLPMIRKPMALAVRFTLTAPVLVVILVLALTWKGKVSPVSATPVPPMMVTVVLAAGLFPTRARAWVKVLDRHPASPEPSAALPLPVELSASLPLTGSTTNAFEVPTISHLCATHRWLVQIGVAPEHWALVQQFPGTQVAEQQKSAALATQARFSVLQPSATQVP